MSRYELRFQFKSNLYPWSCTLSGRRITDDAEAVKWAQYFYEQIGEDYIVTLFKDHARLEYLQPLEIDHETATL